MTELLAALSAVHLRDARDAKVIADAIRVIQELEQDKAALQTLVETLQVELAVARVAP